METYTMRIDGRDVPPSGDEYIDSYNPYTEEPWARIPRGNQDDTARAIEAAHRAFTSGPWSRMTDSERAAVLMDVATSLEDNAEHLAKIEVRDNGKLFAEMLGQCQYGAKWYRYFAGVADKISGEVVPNDKEGFFTYTKKTPLGVIGMITPWNSPLLLLTWKLAAALAAGCTAVIKPSEFTSASTLEMVNIMEEAGLPAGVVNVVTGYGKDVGPALIENSLVKKIAFTGSVDTGREIGATAARGLKPSTLELGGKSPNIVFADADLDSAAAGVISGIFAATGQTCIAGSRLLVDRAVHDDLVKRIVSFAESAQMGDPMDPQTQVGPVTTPIQYEKILDYIDIGKKEGARVALGGGPAEHVGRWFVQPTIFTGVNNSSRLAQEEIFGPVLAVIPFDDEEEAINLANDSRCGLGAGVWTSSISRAFRVTDALEAGTVWVNSYRAVSYTMPFGGFKESGIGRENGADQIEDYLDTKSVWINTGSSSVNPFVLR